MQSGVVKFFSIVWWKREGTLVSSMMIFLTKNGHKWPRMVMFLDPNPSDEKEFAGLNYFEILWRPISVTFFLVPLMEKDHLPNSLACNFQASRLCQGCQTWHLGENKSPLETLQICSAADSTIGSILDLDHHCDWGAWPSFLYRKFEAAPQDWPPQPSLEIDSLIKSNGIIWNVMCILSIPSWDSDKCLLSRPSRQVSRKSKKVKSNKSISWYIYISIYLYHHISSYTIFNHTLISFQVFESLASLAFAYVCVWVAAISCSPVLSNPIRLANRINLARLVTSDQALTPLSESWQDRINGKKSQALTWTYIRIKKVFPV